MFNTKSFGGYISRLRKNADMTQSELADKLNLTRQAISHYEQGDSFPDISILLLIAKIFNVTVNDLINSGTPTRGEAMILENVARGNENITAERIEDVISLAPYLKPSMLNKLADGLMKHDINISNIVLLSEYLNDESVIKMLENSDFSTVDIELLEKLMPLLESRSKYTIFQKIIDGKMDWRLLKAMFIYTDDLQSQIEAAVVEGYLPYEVLGLIREAWKEKMIIDFENINY